MKDYIKPKARTNELVVSQIAEETLVYDLQAHKAYCLNATAAEVWNLCDGACTIEQLSAKLNNDEQINETVINLALGELEQFGLLELSPAKSRQPAELPVSRRLSRREAVRRLGASAALLLPVITMLVAPTPAHAASGLPNGAACSLSEECASGCCFTVEVNGVGENVCGALEICNTEARHRR